MPTDGGASGVVPAAFDDEPTWRQSTVPSSEQAAEEGVPVPRVDGGHVEGGRVLREGHGVAALGGQPPHLGRRLVDVEEREDAARDEPVRIGGTPFVDVPVVVRLDHDFVDRAVRHPR